MVTLRQLRVAKTLTTRRIKGLKEAIEQCYISLVNGRIEFLRRTAAGEFRIFRILRNDTHRRVIDRRTGPDLSRKFLCCRIETKTYPERR
jgi:hypothetical protein